MLPRNGVLSNQLHFMCGKSSEWKKIKIPYLEDDGHVYESGESFETVRPNQYIIIFDKLKMLLGRFCVCVCISKCHMTKEKYKKINKLANNGAWCLQRKEPRFLFLSHCNY